MRIADHIKQSEEIEAKATPEPWVAILDGNLVQWKYGDESNLMSGTLRGPTYHHVAKIMLFADAEAAAHARNDLHKFRDALKVAVEELENHKTETTGYYSCSCTGDAYDTRAALSQIESILEGK